MLVVQALTAIAPSRRPKRSQQSLSKGLVARSGKSRMAATSQPSPGEDRTSGKRSVGRDRCLCIGAVFVILLFLYLLREAEVAST